MKKTEPLNEGETKRTIMVIIGSVSDLPQCEQGLLLLEEAEQKGLVKVDSV